MDQQKRIEKAYAKKVKEYTPTHSLPREMAKAFFTGGLICTLGQVIINTAAAYGLSKDDAATVCTLVLVLGSAVLTGLNIYPKLAKFGGAGALVPITGFANSVVSAAIDSKSEGFVLGLGSGIFTVAGPVLLYGTAAGTLYGVIYWITTLF